jgi:hypothetical protein
LAESSNELLLVNEQELLRIAVGARAGSVALSQEQA